MAVKYLLHAFLLDYVVLLPGISNPDMFEDARIELRALVEGNQQFKRDNSDSEDLSDNFNQLGDSIVQFVIEIDVVIMRKNQEVDSKSKKAMEQVSYAEDEVARSACISVSSLRFMNTSFLTG